MKIVPSKRQVPSGAKAY